eukprot:gene10942-13401_t
MASLHKHSSTHTTTTTLIDMPNSSTTSSSSSTSNNDLNKLKSSLSQRAMARRSVCLNASTLLSSSSSHNNNNNTSSSNNNNNNNTTTTFSVTDHQPSSTTTMLSKEEPIKFNSTFIPKSPLSSSSKLDPTTPSSNNKKMIDRPSINPSVRKPTLSSSSKDVSSLSNNNNKLTPSTTTLNTTPTKKPTTTTNSASTTSLPQPPSTTTAATNPKSTTDDSIIRHTISSMQKMKVVQSSHTVSERETRKPRSVSVSNGTLFNNNSSSSNNSNSGFKTTPTKSNPPPPPPPSNINELPPTSTTDSAEQKSKPKDDVFARLSSITKPVTKSRSNSVSASTYHHQQQQQQQPTPPKESSTLTSKILPKLLRTSKTKKDDKKEQSSSSLSSTLPASTNLTKSSSKDFKSPSKSESLTSSSSSSSLSKSSSSSSTNSLAKYKCNTMTPSIAIKLYSNELTLKEQEEILDYPNVYFTGNTPKKIKFNASLPNNGYDNDQGDYKIVEHDQIAYRYEVISILGQGSFCQVVKSYDHKTGEFVALKILRNEKRFYQQALTEIKILEFLKQNDPNSTAHIVHLNDHFTFRNHLCITFELLSMNLYEFIKGNNFQGFTIQLIRRFAAQILTALNFLSKRNIIHADLKPENILLKQPTKSGIKLIDFGSSCFENEQIYTYIQSRFYRSPEIILGIGKYDKSIDIWSLGCILAELFTGIPLFPGSDENEQLALIMELIGAPTPSMIENASRKDSFFEVDGSPKPVKNQNTGEYYGINSKHLKSILKSNNSEIDEFIDFLYKCLKWNPLERIQPDEALKHNFVSQLTVTPPQLTTSNTTP